MPSRRSTLSRASRVCAAAAAECDVRYGTGMLDSQLDLMLEFFGY
ncbi:MAG: hypothetical protein QM699_03095 [Amaricoccus sp.]